MNIHAALQSQYHASLLMLKHAIAECPKDLWLKEPIPFWRVAYHTLYFTHLYLAPNLKSFRPWKHHRDKAQSLGSPSRKPAPVKPYTQKQILAYWSFCDKLVDTALPTLDLAAPTCGFWWYNLPKLDHQINNIRHIQHHAAILSHRLRAAGKKGIDWIGRAASRRT